MAKYKIRLVLRVRESREKQSNEVAQLGPFLPVVLFLFPFCSASPVFLIYVVSLQAQMANNLHINVLTIN